MSLQRLHFWFQAVSGIIFLDIAGDLWCYICPNCTFSNQVKLYCQLNSVRSLSVLLPFHIIKGAQLFMWLWCTYVLACATLNLKSTILLPCSPLHHKHTQGPPPHTPTHNASKSPFNSLSLVIKCLLGLFRLEPLVSLSEGREGKVVTFLFSMAGQHHYPPCVSELHLTLSRRRSLSLFNAILPFPFFSCLPLTLYFYPQALLSVKQTEEVPSH